MVEPVVERVDHVYVPYEGDAARRVFDFLTSTLGLPMAWPFVPYGTGETRGGGVGLGNLHLEILESNAPWGPSFVARHPARVSGIALAPPTVDDEFIAELDRRRIPHLPPVTITGDGSDGYTNVAFGGFIARGADPDSVAFVCRYHQPEVRDEKARRSQLKSRGGGLLGVVEADELIVSTRDFDEAARRWQNLFDPTAPLASGLWRPGWGPSLRLIEGDDDAVLALVISVQSLNRSAQALARVGVDAESVAEGLRIQADSLMGLDLRLRAR